MKHNNTLGLMTVLSISVLNILEFTQHGLRILLGEILLGPVACVILFHLLDRATVSGEKRSSIVTE